MGFQVEELEVPAAQDVQESHLFLKSVGGGLVTNSRFGNRTTFISTTYLWLQMFEKVLKFDIQK